VMTSPVKMLSLSRELLLSPPLPLLSSVAKLLLSSLSLLHALSVTSAELRG